MAKYDDLIEEASAELDRVESQLQDATQQLLSTQGEVRKLTQDARHASKHQGQVCCCAYRYLLRMNITCTIKTCCAVGANKTINRQTHVLQCVLSNSVQGFVTMKTISRAVAQNNTTNPLIQEKRAELVLPTGRDTLVMHAQFCKPCSQACLSSRSKLSRIVNKSQAL